MKSTYALLLVCVFLPQSDQKSQPKVTPSSQLKVSPTPAATQITTSTENISRSQDTHFAALTEGQWNILLTLGLVVVGALQAWILRRQATIMQKHATELENLSKAAKDNAEAANKNATATKEVADASKLSAEAAKASADALMNSQRAWITVILEFIPGAGRILHGLDLHGVDSTTFHLQLSFRNDGQTTAWIKEKKIGAMIVEAGANLRDPDYSIMELLDHDIQALPSGREIPPIHKPVTCQGAITSTPNRYAVIYGVVKYRDPFSEERETRFAYFVDRSYTLQRMTAYHRYNALI